MKKRFRTVLCAALLAMALSIPAFAAEADSPLASPAPANQGDFSVLVNGEYVTFTDAVPKIKNDRSFLPFVAVFEQLGFAEEDMTWDGASKTVTATKGDLTISLTIGQNQITLIEGGQTSVIATDAAPYIEPSLSRTYIPFGLVADALNYNVGWDNQQRTVIIDDVDAILAANTETYARMDQLLDYSRSFAEKNQKVTGSYAVDLNMTSAADYQTMDFVFTADGDYTMITADSSAFQFETDMALDWSMSLNGADISELLTSSGDLPDIPSSIDFNMRGDLMKGTLYFQSAALAELMGQTELSGAWYKLDLAALLEQAGDTTGLDYSALMSAALAEVQTTDFEQLLAFLLKSVPLTDVNNTTADALAAINALVGDSAFQKSGSSYVSTADIEGVKLSMTLYTSGSKVNGYGLEMTAADPLFGTMQISASMKDTKLDLVMRMDMSELDDSIALTMTMTMDGVYQATNAKPVTAPPANAAILDLTDLEG